MSRRERELWAYLDRELAARPRERLEERLTPRSEEQAELDRMGALSSAIRASWSQGPRAPAAELVIQALRPELRQIDAERRQWSPAQRLRALLGGALRPAPLSALAGAGAALALFLVVGLPARLPDEAPLAVSSPLRFGSPQAIYDLDEEKPVLVYSVEEGVTVIWLLEDAPGDKISRGSRSGQWA